MKLFLARLGVGVLVSIVVMLCGGRPLAAFVVAVVVTIILTPET